MPYVALNNAASTLSGGLTSIATAISVQVGHGAKFAVGANYSYLTLQDASSNIEIVKLTGVTGDVLTIVRAQDGTAARTWAIGDVISCRPCAAGFNDSAVGPQTNTSTSKVTPVDADELPLTDSAATFGLKKLTWANLKATLVTYFNTLFTKVDGSNATGTWSINTSGNAATATNATSATNATNVTTNANLTGHVTSVGNAAVLGSFTKAQLNTAVSDADLASSGANSDITSMTAVTSINRTGGTSIKGINTNTAAAAGYVGEYIESFAGPVSAPASNTYGDITSITLTAGDWDISAIAASVINTGVTITSVISGIGTAPGTSGAGLTNGDNQGYSVPPTAQYLPTITIPPKRVLIASTTTYYLKMWMSYASGTPQFQGRISARRVR